MNKINRTKIFIDCHVFDDGFQGTRTYLEGIYSNMIKYENFEFFFAASDVVNLQSVFGTHENVKYIRYKYHNKFGRLLFDIPRIIKKYKIDFAHFQYIVSPIKNCKYIVTTHDLLFVDFPDYFPVLNRLKNTFLFRQSLKMADIKLTVSNYSKQQLAAHFKLEDMVVTPNAVNEVFYEDYDKEAVKKEVGERFGLKKYIIYISRWEPRKNHELILKSFVDLNLYKDFHLVFIGDNSIYNKNYFDLFNQLEPEVQKRVLSLRKTDFHSMITLLRGADVSVYPSIAEGFGIPPLESIAAKIPTLCSNTTAMSDFDFMNQFLFDPHDQEEFNEKLKFILQNDVSSEMERLSKILKQRYNWNSSAAVLKAQIVGK